MDTYTVGDYLLDRLAELGATEVFGVPGDFNLQFLDHVEAHEQLRWVGAANELNAGYAADGYARLRGIGALVTTYGVGELSALNAVAGSYAERVPVVHVVGAPSKDAQASGATMHHTLGDGDFAHFKRIAAEVTCAQADLNVADAVEEIDRVLRQVMTHRRPGYILLSTDVARSEVAPPQQPLGGPRSFTSQRALREFTLAARDFLTHQQVTVLADLLVHRLGAMKQLDALLATDLPRATLMWGKTLVDESHPKFLGVYAGKVSDDSVRQAVEDAPRLIMAGVQFTDTTTASFSQRIDPARVVELQADHAKVGEQTFAPLALGDALESLAQVVSDPEVGASGTIVTAEASSENTAPEESEDAPLRQDDLWPTLAASLTEGNIVVADQGTSFFGLASMRLPRGVTFLGQPLWGSIGYTLPAAMGAGLASPDRRPVLVIGDGSAQLTVQELGTWLREGISGVVVLINNRGYTVERSIHGERAAYNDITEWDWQRLPRALGGNDRNLLTLRASTLGELREALQRTAKEHGRLVLVEVFTDAFDYPKLLVDVGKAIAETNSR